MHSSRTTITILSVHLSVFGLTNWMTYELISYADYGRWLSVKTPTTAGGSTIILVEIVNIPNRCSLENSVIAIEDSYMKQSSIILNVTLNRNIFTYKGERQSPSATAKPKAVLANCRLLTKTEQGKVCVL